MQIKLALTSNPQNVFPWISDFGISIKGSINQNGLFLKNQAFHEHIKQSINSANYRSVIENLDGFYSMVLDFDSHLIAAVDLATTTHLFYKLDGDKLIVGDDYRVFISEGAHLNKKAVDQYLVSGYCYANQTLLKDVFQIPAGCMLIVNKSNGQAHVESYYDYLPPKHKEIANDDLIARLHETHLNVFGKLVSSLDGCRVVLPLSGGYDSRLVLEMLKHFKYDNILCVTWGKPSDWQVKIAKQVAFDLNVNWQLINANRQDWQQWYQREFNNEMQNCGAIAAIPYLQENVLIDKLKQMNLLSRGAIFVSGNSGDFIEGEHIPSKLALPLSTDKILAVIKNKHQRLNALKDWASLDQTLIRDIDNFLGCYNYDIMCFFEFWEWRERQSKFVTNCIKPFENQGFEWRMPFWDKEIMNFWRDIDIDVKKGRSLFYQYAHKYMNQQTTRANPNISIFKRYAERLKDPRFGCYVGNGIVENMSADVHRFFPNVNFQNIRNKPFVYYKLNSLAAMDVLNRLSGHYL